MITKQDLESIIEYLKLTSVKDTDFKNLSLPFTGDETIVVVHNGKNYKTTINDLFEGKIVEIEDSLESESVDKALSANQGKVLNEKKQDTLISGENIKTLNNESILGEGNISLIDFKDLVGKKTIKNGEIFNDYNNNQANAPYSHSEGKNTISNNVAEHAEGKNNVSNKGTIHSVGIGKSNLERENAQEILDSGESFFRTIGGYNGKKLIDLKGNKEWYVRSIQSLIYQLLNNVTILTDKTDYIDGGKVEEQLTYDTYLGGDAFTRYVTKVISGGDAFTPSDTLVLEGGDAFSFLPDITILRGGDAFTNEFDRELGGASAAVSVNTPILRGSGAVL